VVVGSCVQRSMRAWFAIASRSADNGSDCNQVVNEQHDSMQHTSSLISRTAHHARPGGTVPKSIPSCRTLARAR